MGEKIVEIQTNEQVRMKFIEHLIDDITALEQLLKANRFEDDIVRIGAEQEICLIDKDYQPAPINLKLLEALNDKQFTTELATYNIELNLEPLKLHTNCFSEVNHQLNTFLDSVRQKANKLGADILLAGILPTIGKKEVDLSYLTPIARYIALNEILTHTKGSNFDLKIRGADELFLKHDSVMFEACNTSFQLHLQIPSHDFISSYNWAQAIAGPVLAVCCNSPLLMGRELWKETRIALFQQSLDTRKTSNALVDQAPRVGFGDEWETGCVANMYKKSISTHNVLLIKEIEEYSTKLIAEDKIPKLPALQLHNGTVYRWNRPCYGVGGGKPHLRIENRYIPSGPTVVDQIANFAFWVGLMVGRPKKYDNMPEQMDFKVAKTNFIKAARTGKETLFLWDGQEYSAKKLVLHKLLPIAHLGLQKFGVDDAEREHFLEIIEQRVKGRTGDQWQIQNYRKLRSTFKTRAALKALTKAIVEKQKTGLPVHQWEDVKIEETEKNEVIVKDIMSTRLFKLQEHDYLSMAKAIMKWNAINHMPIENVKGDLVGLLTTNYLQEKDLMVDTVDYKVSEVMLKNPITIDAEASIAEAEKLFSSHEIGCLPVCKDGLVIGILSTKDLD
ncbi:hypothetical protein GCM10011414_00930 [Croceivirga lutea]|uniref:CBS domain-containing protein n=1 Tax=Croceivirga lutea TaxID=1775167 RepID=UPI00163B39B4|nr:CBS domain-containing protein [Croceivirga lutea]GGG35378.1 hypothetical protein GCM10011414_00930 [Croceivirga lutea]